VRQRRHHLALDRDAVLVDFSVKGLAEGNHVVEVRRRFKRRFAVRLEPEVEAIKKVESTPIDYTVPLRVIFGAEEDGGAEEALKALHHPAVMIAIGWELEEGQHLGGALKLHDAAFLLQGESGDPNGDEPVLAERQSEVRVAGDLKEEATVASSVNPLPSRWPPKWDPAKDKRSRVVSDFLPILISLLADELNGFQLPQAAFGGAEMCEQCLCGREA
jgi:hypothetical protein